MCQRHDADHDLHLSSQIQKMRVADPRRHMPHDKSQACTALPPVGHARSAHVGADSHISQARRFTTSTAPECTQYYIVLHTRDEWRPGQASPRTCIISTINAPVSQLGKCALHGTASHEHDNQSPTRAPRCYHFPCSAVCLGQSRLSGCTSMPSHGRVSGCSWTPAVESPGRIRKHSHRQSKPWQQTCEADLFARSREHRDYTSQSQEHQVVHIR